MMVQPEARASLVFGAVLLLCAVLTGAAFYSVVLPKFQPLHEAIAPPRPYVPETPEQLHPINAKKEVSIPPLVALPGTTVVRVAHHTSNAHHAWGLANMGKVTDPGSIFARQSITMQLRRAETITQRINALRAMAVAFNAGDTASADSPSTSKKETGVHFFTVGGDTSSWVISQTNKALQTVNPAFEAEIIGFSGLSAGEDTFMGLPEWYENPQKALGGVVAGVPYDSGWDIMLFWCAQNNIPFNSDQDYYDPRALNFVEVESPQKAATMYRDKETVERIFRAEGQDRKGYPVSRGGKALVDINGVVTRTPWEKHLAIQRGGLVTMASTKHYPNQTPQFLVGLKQWNRPNQAVVVRMLAAIFEAGQLIEKSQRDIKAKRIEPRSDDDYRWQAVQYRHEPADADNPPEWYAYYDVATVQDRRGLMVDVGGAAVATLQRNLVFFGLGGAGPDRGELIYHRFAQLAKPYAAASAQAYPTWETVFNKAYLEEVLRRFPALARAEPALPTFVVALKAPQELTYHVPFEQGQDAFSPAAKEILNLVLEQVVQAGDANIEIHGHTDSYGAAESNLDLSRRRGEAVSRWLKQKMGASFPNRVRVVPHGENDLLLKDQLDGEDNQELMAQNRRVVLKIW